MGMTPPPSTTTTTIGSIGYGPEIDIDLDINIGTIENPIDDIDLGKKKLSYFFYCYFLPVLYVCSCSFLLIKFVLT